MRILTGLQPSGRFHLGNYFSAIKKILGYQSRSELFLFIANLHALTSFQTKEKLEEYTKDSVLDLLALGVDPSQCTLWIQSQVPEVVEMSWYLSMAFTVSELNRAHSFKDKTAKGIIPSVGLYTYPVLMASDILCFKTNKVPVGKDQKQHLEFAVEIARSFNHKFGEVFAIPEPEIDQDTALIPGTDGAKMSKSYGNTIGMFDSDKDLKKKVMSILSDAKGIDEPKDPESSVIFQIHSLFLNEEEQKIQKDKYLTPGTGYGDLKKDLLKSIQDYFADARIKRTEFENRPDLVSDILKSGKDKAQGIAREMLEITRQRLGIL
jgi:tryptophanyl-tRNA synthetase